MKCPKCGYLGFETVDRCRNCGYDFSLAPSRVEGLAARGVEGAAPADIKKPTAIDIERSDTDLTLNETAQPASALADLELGDKSLPTGTPSIDPVVIGKSSLDLDRLIGAPDDQPIRTPSPETPRADVVPDAPRSLTAPDEPTPLLDAVEAEAEAANLPLFGRSRIERETEGSPIVAAPRPAGPPLAVRRATPDVARPRTRTPRPGRPNEPPLSFPTEVPLSIRRSGGDAAPHAESDALFQPASRMARVVAALIDLLLLGGICFGVLYLTLRIANLTFDDVRVLPVVPMTAFLILLVAGYLIAFTAAGGQTIGKMATGIRVVAEDGRPVDISSAVLRLAGNVVNIATLGLAWLPALFSADGRSLADRLAGTRVVRA